MKEINDAILEQSIDHVEGLSDADYEKLIDAFEKEQPELSEYFNEKLEDLDDEDQQNDSITILLILYHTIQSQNPNLFMVSKNAIEACEKKQAKLLEEISEISKTSELLDDEELSQSYISNKSMHNFVMATLDPSEEDSPFDEENSEKTYHFLKVCVDTLTGAK